MGLRRRTLGSIIAYDAKRSVADFRRESVKIEEARNSIDHGEGTAQSNSHRVHGLGRYVGCLCRQLYPSYSKFTLYSCLVNESDGVIVSAPGERYPPPLCQVLVSAVAVADAKPSSLTLF
jgi:hypothetical protein